MSNDHSTPNPYRPYVDFNTINASQLSPLLPDTSDYDQNDYFRDGPSEYGNTQRDLLKYALMKYLTTAMASPFEVAHTLIQVQHLPTHFQRASIKDKTDDEDDEDDEFEDSDDELYSTNKNLNPNSESMSSAAQRKSVTDRAGYVLESSLDLEATKPDYQLENLEGGLWNTMSVVIKHPSEGFLSLWKGQFTYWLYDMAQLFLQPAIETTLNDTFDLYDDTIPLVHLDSVGPNILTLVASHLVTGLVLNPLEIVRTRLIIQASDNKVRKYSGPFHALATIIHEEGIEALYWGQDVIPTALYHTLTPLIQHATPLIIDRYLQLSPSEAPLVYALAELGLNLVQLLVTLPLDTIRKRLQAQPQPRVQPQRAFKSCIRIRTEPYHGPSDCAYKMITEEAAPMMEHHLHGASTYTHRGIGALYRGFGFHSTLTLFTTLVSTVTGIKDDGEW